MLKETTQASNVSFHTNKIEDKKKKDVQAKIIGVEKKTQRQSMKQKLVVELNKINELLPRLILKVTQQSKNIRNERVVITTGLKTLERQ